MVVSSSWIGLIPNLTDWQSRHLQLQQDLEDIEAAFQSGDLTAAQDALSDLESLKSPTPPPQTSGVNPMEEGMATLEEALESGDLEAAKAAFSSLKAGFERGAQQGPPPPTQVGESGNDVIQTLLDLLNRASLNGESEETTSALSALPESDSNAETTPESILAAILALFRNNISTSEVTTSSSKTNLNAQA